MGNADLHVTIRLWGGLKKAFNDYKIPIVVKEGIPPAFAEPLEDLFVNPGTAVDYQYPTVVEGTNALKDVIIDFPTDLAIFVVADADERRITYDGNPDLKKFGRGEPYDIVIQLVDEVARKQVYF